jgi:hypothetical protein
MPGCYNYIVTNSKIAMKSYFSYSGINKFYDAIKQGCIRHPFFGEWNVTESEHEFKANQNFPEISELYY